MLAPLHTLALSALLLTQPPAPAPALTPADPPPPSGTSESIVTEITVKPPPKVVPGAADDKIADSDDLLAALETAGAKIRTLTADLTHINRKSELEAGQTITKRGRLLFQNEPSPADSASGSPSATPPTHKSRLFQIEFTSVEFGDERHAEDQVFIFDGQWLVEKQPGNKQMFKYRVVPPGQTTDPLAVGEGPFPIPIGQKKDRILERFYATLLPPEDGFPVPLTDDTGKPNPKLAWVKETYQLRLMPKPTARESRDFQEIRLWYTRDHLLPRVARTLKPDESADEILLTNLQTDQPLPPGAFDTAEKPGWNIQVQQFNPGKADK
ncbi:MAG: LolA family protein [Phycisphaerales bacterium]